MPDISTNSNHLTKLKLRWGIYALVSFTSIGLLYILLSNLKSPTYVLRWALQACAVMGIQLINLWRFLPQNFRQSETTLLPVFGPGNAMTLTRGTLIAMLSGFLLLESLPGYWVWIPAILYIVSDITDFLDGYLARLSNTVTRLGETLDMNLDALGVLVVTLLAFQFGSVPWWYLPFGFARYLFLIGLYSHKRAGRPEYPLNPSNTRRLFAGLQMGFITVMLFPVLGPPGTTFAATVFLVPFLSMFVIDYLQVTGQLERVDFWTDWNLAPVKSWLMEWVPLALRGVTVLLYGNQARGLAMMRPPNGHTIPEAARPIFLALSMIFMVLFALGILGRTSAILALISTGVQLQWVPFNFAYGVLILILIYLLFVGNGKYALWNPEEWLISNRAGQKKS